VLDSPQNLTTDERPPSVRTGQPRGSAAARDESGHADLRRVGGSSDTGSRQPMQSAGMVVGGETASVSV
jgi:hypothetical protein